MSFTCTKCASFVTLNLLFDNPQTISVKCPFCLDENEYLLDDYLQKNPKKIKSVIQTDPKYKNTFCYNCNKWLTFGTEDSIHQQQYRIHKTAKLINLHLKNPCPIHTFQEITFFCIKCQKHLCYSCLNQHQTHNYVRLSSLVNDTVISTIKQNCNQASKTILDLNEFLKRKINSFLTENLDKLNKSFNKARKINDDILKFVKTLVYDSQQQVPNYYIYHNLLFHSNFTNLQNDFEMTNSDITFSKVEEFNNYINNFLIISKNEKFEYSTANIPTESVEKSIDIDLFTKIKELDYHKNNILKLLLLQDGRLASVSRDNSIIIYDFKSNKCALTITNFQKGPVLNICQLKDGRVVTSGDSIIKFWAIDESSFKCIWTIEHKFRWCLINQMIPITNNRICCVLNISEITFWNVDNYVSLHTIVNPPSINICVTQLKNSTIVTGSSKGDITFWNEKTYEKEQYLLIKLSIHSFSLHELDNGLLIVMGEKICIINSIHLQIQTILDFQTTECNTAFYPDNTMLFLSNDTLIHMNLFDYTVIKTRKLIKGKYEKIYKINNNMIALYDKSINLYQI